MIHFFIGTKAQFIKMMPIMREMDRRGLTYNFIDAGQHASLTGQLLKQFNLRVPDVFLRNSAKSITTIPQAMQWMLLTVQRLLFHKEAIYQSVFRNRKGICLIHGDTLTTLISLLYAKRCNLKVAHVEAGLRSFNLLDPFPEELVRLIAMRFSDILFAPSQWAYDNLCKMGYQEKALNVGANTGMDAVSAAIAGSAAIRGTPAPYGLVTIHRLETLFSKDRMQAVVHLLARIARDQTIRFVLHEPTRNHLARHNLLETLAAAPNIELLPLMQYDEFIRMIAGSEFVITDGGSIQEECYYLNKPCLVMRTKTERMEGVGENIVLAEFNPDRIGHFLRSYSSLKRKEAGPAVFPSAFIVDTLLQYADA